ncbi:MAG: hypothetical protein AMS16_03770 [Planctomycetes bacterium DG_58]|nr:MAG: hypothetical protein AMS16_03770 [Planctomycetes bacterium DG_58]KPL04320.1 MAG: hypothetical protein AMK75_01290 [Planctomycetes bacterium SM23_65]
MRTKGTEFTVGIFVLAGILLLMAMIIWFGRVVELGRERYEVSAIFDNVHGMARGTPVRYLGIDIGELKETGLTRKGDKVRLVLSISAKYNIPTDAVLSVRPTGILGDVYLEFGRGKPEEGYLAKDGSAEVHGEPTVTIDEIAIQLTTFTAKLSKTLDELGGNLTELSASLNQVFGDEQVRKDIKRTLSETPDAVKSFREMTDRVAAVGGQARELLKQMKTTVEKLDSQINRQGKNLDELTDGLRKSADAVSETLASLDEILKRFNEGKGSVGALIQKDEFHEKLVQAVDRMNEALLEIKKMAEGVHRKWGR